MMKKNNLYNAQSVSEIGSPIDLRGNETDIDNSSTRVMPSQFTFPTVPMGCTFIRNVYGSHQI